MQDKKEAIKDFIMFIVIMMVMLIFGIYAGALLLLPFVIPLLFTIYSYRHKLRYAIVYVFVSSSIAILLPSGIWLIMLFIYGTMGIALGQYLKRQLTHEPVIFKTWLASLIGLLLLLFVMQNLFLTEDIGNIMRQEINRVEIPTELFEQLSVLGQIGNSDALSLESEFKQMMLVVVPSVFAFTFFIHAVIIYVLSNFVLRKTGHAVMPPPKLSTVNLPGNPIVGTLFMIIMALLLTWLFPYYGEVFTVNAMYLVLLIFSVQGIAVLAYAVKLFKVHKVVKVIIFCFALTLLQLHGLAIIGWLEVGFKMRERLGRRAQK